MPIVEQNNSSIIDKYSGMNFAAGTIFMNDGFVYLDENNYPVENPKVKFNEHNKQYKFQAQLYYRCLEIGNIFDGVYLDLSCGRGGGVNFVKDNFNFNKHIGVDLNPKHIEFCKNWERDATFLVGSATQIPLESESVDVITTIEASGYYNPYEEYIKESFRVLKPGGILIETHPYLLYDKNIVNVDFYAKKIVDITSNVRMSCAMDKYRHIEKNPKMFKCLLFDEQRYVEQTSLYTILVYKKNKPD